MDIDVAPRTTSAAEGLPRWRFTVAEVEAMVTAGILEENARVELIGGELVPMSPKGIFHERIKNAVIAWFFDRRTPTVVVATETTLRLAADTYLEPDIAIFERRVGFEKLNGSAVLLAVEVADSSLAFDLGRKARVYASEGVRELWVIDARGMVLIRHLAPTPDGYATISTHAADDLVTPAFADAAFALRLADLDLV
jgi:Uma2 family endonuclease